MGVIYFPFVIFHISFFCKAEKRQYFVENENAYVVYFKNEIGWLLSENKRLFLNILLAVA